MTAQYDLFYPNDEESLNTREIAEVREYITRSNKAQFSRMKELELKFIKLSDELDRVRGLLIKERK